MGNSELQKTFDTLTAEIITLKQQIAACQGVLAIKEDAVAALASHLQAPESSPSKEEAA